LLPPPRTLQMLDRLADVGLARCDRRGRWHPGRTTLDRAADRLAVAGILDQRAARYQLEREAWAWWCDELAWRALPRDAKRRRRDPHPGQIVLELREVPGLTTRRRRGAHPTWPGGRADFAAALAILRSEAFDTREAAA
jgi:DNA-binding IclR family transcriptional regulator